MSTSIKEIEGRYEVRLRDRIGTVNLSMRSNYQKCIIHINRFSGGIKGRMLQLTILHNSDGYIQLTSEQVDELITTLTNAFDDNIYPSE